MDMAAGGGDFVGVDCALHLVGYDIKVVFVMIKIIEIVHNDAFDPATRLELWKYMENLLRGQLSSPPMCDLADHLLAHVISEAFSCRHKDNQIYDTKQADFQY